MPLNCLREPDYEWYLFPAGDQNLVIVEDGLWVPLSVTSTEMFVLVLILVIEEDGLWESPEVFWLPETFLVLILVIEEDGLWDKKPISMIDVPLS